MKNLFATIKQNRGNVALAALLVTAIALSAVVERGSGTALTPQAEVEPSPMSADAGTLSPAEEPPAAEPVAATPLLGTVAIVDPGHGGYDCGAVGRFTDTLEKDLNLQVSLKLREVLIQGGASVVMTRETDVALCPESTQLGQKKKEDMAARANIIDEADADVVLSIHMNEYTNSRYYGAQVFYLEENTPPEAKALARCIQDAMREGLDPNNTRKEKSGDFYILRMRPASVLVECGFLSNQKEEALLCDEAYQEKVAWSIYAGLVDYLSQSIPAQ